MNRLRTNEEWLPTWLFILVLPFLWLEACLHAFDSAGRAFAESVRRGTPWPKGLPQMTQMKAKQTI